MIIINYAITKLNWTASSKTRKKKKHNSNDDDDGFISYQVHLIVVFSCQSPLFL